MGGHSHKRTPTPILRLFFGIGLFFLLLIFLLHNNVLYYILYYILYYSVGLTYFYFSIFFCILFTDFHNKLSKKGIYGQFTRKVRGNVR